MKTGSLSFLSSFLSTNNRAKPFQRVSVKYLHHFGTGKQELVFEDHVSAYRFAQQAEISFESPRFKPLSNQMFIELGIKELVGKRVCAFTPVTGKEGIVLGLAEANQPGYWPIPAMFCHAETYDVMSKHAADLNKQHFELDFDAAARIVCSSMFNRKAV